MALENAYSGNPFSSLDLTRIKADLELARSLNQTRPQSDEVHYVIETADVKPFPLPIVIGDDVYVDARTFTTLDKSNELKIRNLTEHALRLDQARWELVWKRNGGKLGALMSQMYYHHEIFSKWVTDAIDHANTLAPYQSAQVKALAALFSVGQFYNNFEDEVKALRMQQMLENELGIASEVFESVTGHTDYLFPRNISEFVEMVKQADISSRLKDLSVVSLQAMLSASFGPFVSYDRQLATSAIEYPPTLFCMTKACLDNNMFNRFRFGGMVKKTDAAKKKDKFEGTFNTLMNQYTKPLNTK
ncbi:hypothetical protein STRATTON_277 [Erwinia phage vB_EamM_Stratton]|uniref:Uncharacterized protein n=2 Tax=Erskinevirus EaH2 TaxID=2169883 RepID=A0A1B2IHI4_9CAUD|nr:hypothetical protein G173_gp175 [Erwinia phage phiEaH2]AFQ96720.1 hypothetical protein [Erwinia phage phiEaH2]ANZ50702.1 hypothetical protein STRATTON_277 [Erwinia phage vB_EamM_Stratton]